jgi:hypothetical protein
MSEQQNLDPGCDAPTLLTFKSESAEGPGKWLSQAEPVKQVERNPLR